ncbi:MAG: hypothetical protein EPN25_05555 [Nitrospirae bacterium]|nr:MAG: hypothetical protein EPN25_05555 [Nitrospirota bacterium]
MIETGVVLFSLLSAGLCFLVVKRYEQIEKSELTSYFLLFGWGSFLFGLSLTRLTTIIHLAGLVW